MITIRAQTSARAALKKAQSQKRHYTVIVETEDGADYYSSVFGQEELASMLDRCADSIRSEKRGRGDA